MSNIKLLTYNFIFLFVQCSIHPVGCLANNITTGSSLWRAVSVQLIIPDNNLSLYVVNHLLYKLGTKTHKYHI